MKRLNAKAVLGLSVCLALGSVMAQQMPSDEVINKAMQAAQKKAGSVLGEADRQAKPSSATTQRPMPQLDPRTAIGVDPAAIAEQYKNLGKKTDDSDAPELIVFVSLSMPEASLKRIGQQAKQAGAVVVFRGTKFGLRKGTWIDSMNALKPVVDTGADVQIHPELFGRYNVSVVPTVVVAYSPKAGCQDDACAAMSAAVVGDVSLDYALDQLTSRTDTIGKIARDRLKRLRNS